MSRPSHATVVAYLALFVALGGSAYAVGSGSSAGAPVIRACYSKRTGALRLLQAGSCRRGERELAWNQQGRRGATGAPGPAGARGPEGPAGSVATANFYTKAQSDGKYLAAGAQAADSAELGGVPAGGYLQTGATAANASELGGAPASQYLQTGTTAANSLALNGQPSTAFAAASLFGSALTPTFGPNVDSSCFAGAVMLFAGKLPQGWVLADGQTLTIADSGILYAVIGHHYDPPSVGGPSSTDFDVPNLAAADPASAAAQHGEGVNYAICNSNTLP
jgi:hypothetical protein